MNSPDKENFLHSFQCVFSLSAASLQKRGIITIFMSQTHSPAPVRKLKNTSPTSHYKGRPIVFLQLRVFTPVTKRL